MSHSTVRLSVLRFSSFNLLARPPNVHYAWFAFLCLALQCIDNFQGFMFLRYNALEISQLSVTGKIQQNFLILLLLTFANNVKVVCSG